MVSSKLPKLLKLNSGDSGSIFFFQNKYFLKKTKRIFIINQKKKKIRGNHAHKKAFQFLIAVNKKISSNTILKICRIPVQVFLKMKINLIMITSNLKEDALKKINRTTI